MLLSPCSVMNRSKSLCAKCFVPSCNNTTTNSRNKVFVLVNETCKRKFCMQANIEYQPGRRLYCCEDHLKLEEDLENFDDWNITKKRPTLKSSAKLRLPKHFSSACIKDEPASPSEEPSLLKSLLLEPTDNLPTRPINMTPTAAYASTYPVEVDITVPCHVSTKNKSTSTKGSVQVTKGLPSSASSTASATVTSPSPCSFTSDTEFTVTSVKDKPNYNARMQMLQFITNNPKQYIGLPKRYFWLISYIATQSATRIKELDIIVTLSKIKLNDPIHRICDEFQISKAKLSQALHSGIKVLADFFQNLIYMPPLLQIKQNLPLAFKTRYSNVVLLLDTFEIEIQKPNNRIRQAQTWSHYKNANTVKYLIGYTPNGFVGYVSKGYGGRISDKTLVEKTDLVDCLPHNAVIMVARGFKEIETLLIVKGIQLLRPPSVFASNKPTKEEVVASLRVHIKRVIRRIRQFRLLQPHSVVSYKHVGYLDHIVLIACGLINLQIKMIKSG